MIVKRILLRNIRSHVETEVEFEEGINVFIGGTGSGKTSILMAIEYALLGRRSSVGNNLRSLLRVGEKVGYIELTIEHGGDEYKICRGLVRNGDSVSADQRRNILYKNGRPILCYARVSEMDEKIAEILGIPYKSFQKMFDILYYSRQDEIRNLIEMRPEERQIFIDSVLQLEKYRKTYENLKEVLNKLEKECMEMERKLSIRNRVLKDLEEMKNKKGILEKERELILSDVEEKKRALKTLDDEYSRIVSEYSEVEEKIKKKKKLEGELLSLRKSIDDISKRIDKLREQIKERIEWNEEDLKNVENEVRKIEGEIRVVDEKIRDVREELRKINELKEGVCPLCKQPVTGEYLQKLRSMYEETLRDLMEKKEQLEELLEKSKSRYNMLKELEKKYIEYVSSLKTIESLERSRRDLEERMLNLEAELRKIQVDEEYAESIKAKAEEVRKKREKLIASIKILEGKLEEISKELNYILKKIVDLENELKRIGEMEEKVKKYKKVIALLRDLREDIKNLREYAREKYLDIFRYEFRRLFEEIRHGDETYTVDIEQNYEPVAYTAGHRVSVSSLSGGERTCVALAYRLALSYVAAMAGGVSAPEMLMLDEPTTGLDQDDIVVLASVLRRIPYLRQIIVVTHAEELKMAGDVRFLVRKEGNRSIVQRID